jgi:hypothetical protein
MTKPHVALTITTPDEVAECWEGVEDALYEKLWYLTKFYDNSHLANIEDMGPGDVVGINSVAKFWGKLTDEEQMRLNELAEAVDAWNADMDNRFPDCQS